ncbi:FecR family protein [Sediminispirochaeta smaragdinae]|uniref:FecR protein domain-containing protein n=1 Tax=Sediminispirochaeta smaragdinae (strain DSM 11293 / JCM 15392 / SEBR 4228) TaxID=573413 RepID=E1R765_SEDSS|nr:FecR family protein [Sediminispirochaeta smaragdinae]ADK81392.1 hypothetical protein Spirs_2277 [Sediminispirochaeta smaragdinae DSM 11293]
MRKEDRKRNILILVICLAWMMPPWTVWGQETTAGNSTGISARAGYIVFSDGGGFEIVRDGQKRYYDPLVDYVEGTELHFGDYINTYEHAFLEILLEPGDRIIKVSEQTSFSIPKGSSAEDVGSLRLTYGRVRARVTKLAGGRSFEVQGPSATAGVRGTDFGFDVIAEKTGDSLEATARGAVYCFEGAVDVVSAESHEELVLDAGTMVLLNETTTEKASPEGRIFSSVLPIDSSRIDYWQKYEFVTALEAEDTDETDDFLALNKAKARKLSAVSGITGTLLLGSALFIAQDDNLFSGMDDREKISTGLAVTGGWLVSTAIISAVMGFGD